MCHKLHAYCNVSAFLWPDHLMVKLGYGYARQGIHCQSRSQQPALLEPDWLPLGAISTPSRPASAAVGAHEFG